MGRRSIISISAVNRIISSSRANKKRRENEELIASNSCKQKELDPEYEVHNVSFNEQSRVAKIEFIKVVRYRTIDRYVQQNYERYPIYSNWKIRHSFINKSVKLTNEALEELNDHDDDLIREFAFEIITRLKNTELIPSWYEKMCIEEDFRQKFNTQQERLNIEKNHLYNIISKKNVEIDNNLSIILKKEIRQRKFEKRLSRIDIKTEKTKAHKKNYFLSIITLCIYNYFGSQKRLKHLANKFHKHNDKLSAIKKEISDIQTVNLGLENQIDQANKNFKKISTEIEDNIKLIKEETRTKLNSIVQLPISFQPQDSSFIPLKSLSGMNYEKIIGCYIIRNKQNQRCYVGQSKDVIKRIRQHFKGTFPNNIIFAEDYFAAKESERNDMFELKIFPCTTKDELDSTEKKLIEDYDSFATGYNGTSGNN